MLRRSADTSLYTSFVAGASKGLGVLLDIDVRLTPVSALAQRLTTQVPAASFVEHFLPAVLGGYRGKDERGVRLRPREVNIHVMRGMMVRMRA